MPADEPKSFLLGAGYLWRTREVRRVVADDHKGMALEQLRPIPPVESNPHRPDPLFRLGRLSYDIDRQQASVSAYTTDGKLRHRWLSRDNSGTHVPANDPQAWNPVDIVGDDNCVFILDQRYQTLYLHAYGREALTLLARSDDERSRWVRLELDERGCVLVFDSNQAKALKYDRRGRFLGSTTASWPEPVSQKSAETSSSHNGNEEPFYPKDGYWLSEPLDSKLYKRQWHRIRMTVSRLPPGTEVEIKTFNYQRPDQAPLVPTDPRFVTAHTLVAPTQPAPDKRDKERVEDCLIQSGPGQYLSISIHLRGDGFGSPVIKGLRVLYPRESYLEYLPPLFSANEPMRVFLDRFLSIFQTEWDEFDRRINESEAFFDPDAVPHGDAMNYLASWLGIELEGDWDPDKKPQSDLEREADQKRQAEFNRQLLKAVPKIFPRRGTVGSLREFVAVYLANISGLTPQQVADTSFPAIVEGFKERQVLMLAQEGGSTLGSAKPLWSDGVVKRLQLGGFAREGEVELVSTGDPERDFFHHFAHRFRIYAPADWIRTAKQEQLLRRSIEAEMPAHVTYELCLVQAGLRVGMQSTVGLDTIVGEPPSMHLSCEPENEASSLPPHNRLGLGATLSGVGPGPAVLKKGARVGNWILN